MAAILHIQFHWGRSPSADVKLAVPICTFQPLPVSYQWNHLAGCLPAQPSSAIDICTKAVWCCGWLFRVVAMGYISLKALLKRHVLREREWTLKSGGGERRWQSWLTGCNIFQGSRVLHGISSVPVLSGVAQDDDTWDWYLLVTVGVSVSACHTV